MNDEQKRTEDAVSVMLRDFDSATSISVSIIGLLPDQYDAIEALEYDNDNAVRVFKMKMIERAWVHYHKRVEEK